jgi:hypothetical protein
MITSLLILSLGFMPILANGAQNTVVFLTDAELNQVLQMAFDLFPGSMIIPMTLLESLGLNSSAVIYYLQSLGYFILY